MTGRRRTLRRPASFAFLLEENGIGKRIFEETDKLLDENGLIRLRRAIVDATIIEAPSSTKNKAGERDPEMRQAKKGSQWHFGMKAHVGVDAGSGLARSLAGTAANVHDITVVDKLLREDDETCYGDSGYLGAEKREEIRGNESFKGIEFRISL